jgi:hypothetical protein
MSGISFNDMKKKAAYSSKNDLIFVSYDSPRPSFVTVIWSRYDQSPSTCAALHHKEEVQCSGSIPGLSLHQSEFKQCFANASSTSSCRIGRNGKADPDCDDPSGRARLRRRSVVFKESSRPASFSHVFPTHILVPPFLRKDIDILLPLALGIYRKLPVDHPQLPKKFQ